MKFKCKIGRPPLFSSPEEMQDLIQAYFSTHAVPGMTGLALHLGFASRQSLYDYEKKEAFSYTIARARLRIEAFWEDALSHRATVRAAIFVLNRMGWGCPYREKLIQLKKEKLTLKQQQSEIQVTVDYKLIDKIVNDKEKMYEYRH